MKRTWIAAAAVCAVAAGCHRKVEISSAPLVAHAALRNAQNVSVGDLTLTQTAKGVRISGTLTGLPPGPHGIHLHQVGVCEAPAFTSAGSHLNPLGREHGLQNPAGPHAGDMPNLTADASGRAVVDITTTRVRMDPNGALFDRDGTAIVVHASADDQKTDPAGNAGARIACGVIARDTGD